MGRGRQKAKQAKVARELKYNGGSTDFDALQAELNSTQTSTHPTLEDDVEPDYSAWIDDEDEDDEEDDEEQ